MKHAGSLVADLLQIISSASCSEVRTRVPSHSFHVKESGFRLLKGGSTIATISPAGLRLLSNILPSALPLRER